MRSAVGSAAGLAVALQEARAAAAQAGGPGRMRAWRVHAYGAPDTELRLETARVPPLRAPDELLVRVHSASINPLDVAMIGGYGRTVLNTLRALEAGRGGSSGDGVEFPLVVGRDFYGEVVRGGAQARWEPGARVWGVVPPHWPGSHAEYVVVKDRWAGPAPEELGSAAGGALYAGLTATSLLRAAGLLGGGGARGRRVLLLGLGGVGHAALQLLASNGAEVVVGCSGELCERAERVGAARALDRHKPDYDDQLSAAGPYEAILDCAGLGGQEAGARSWRFKRYVTLSSPLLAESDARGLGLGFVSSALQLAGQCWAAARGDVSTGLGGLRGDVPGPAAVAAARVPAPAPACLPPHVRWAYFMPCEEDIELLRRRAQNGQFSVPVEATYPWWEAGLALSRAAGGHARGKLLLDFTATPPTPPTPATPPPEQ